ncbi:MAG: dipeptidase E [Polaribacter sp.]|jgi:dipeptidase E
MNLLLLSSSRVGTTGYLSHAVPLIEKFLSAKHALTPLRVLFIPYAGVTIDFEQYESSVKEALNSLNIELVSIHHYSSNNDSKNNGDSYLSPSDSSAPDASKPDVSKQNLLKEQFAKADCILVGGGNTFSLLKQLYKLDLLKIIQDEVKAGKPYIGWSAGSNIAGATIRTTNDMPIVEPPSFDALNLLPWQLNPHYIETNPSGHNGETRQQRLEEFLVANPQSKVIAIPEGTAIICKKKSMVFTEGEQKKSLAYVFSANAKVSISTETDISQLLENTSN